MVNNMNSAEVSALMKALCLELEALNIPLSRHINPQVSVNSRAKRRLGCCTYREGACTIEVSESLLDNPPLLRQTLVHELLHTCYGCRNHGERWKSYAAAVNAAWGLSIERTVQSEELNRLRTETVKYILKCESCGTEIRRSRMSKAVKYPWKYRCRCGGRLKRIKL